MLPKRLVTKLNYEWNQLTKPGVGENKFETLRPEWIF